MREALVLIDFQNDFLAEAALRGVDVEALTWALSRAAETARRAGVPLLFVQFLGDEALQKANWLARDRRLGKAPRCLMGTPGAEFHTVQPRADEPVFHKQAWWDAFLCEGFEDALHERGITQLLLAGLYTDVCVDTTARTAFQKGYGVAVLADGCASRYRPQAEALDTLRTLCDAALIDSRALAQRWPATHAGG